MVIIVQPIAAYLSLVNQVLLDKDSNNLEIGNLGIEEKLKPNIKSHIIFIEYKLPDGTINTFVDKHYQVDINTDFDISAAVEKYILKKDLPENLELMRFFVKINNKKNKIVANMGILIWKNLIKF